MDEYQFTDKGKQEVMIAVRGMEMFGRRKLTAEEWEAAYDSLNAEIETVNAMSAMACDALRVDADELPPPDVYWDPERARLLLDGLPEQG